MRFDQPMHGTGAQASAGPDVTILMPLKQYREDFLRQSLASVFGQSSPQWVLSVIVEKCDHPYFARLLGRELQDPRVTLVVNEGRRLGGALNTGMRRATTGFVAILFADDIWDAHAVGVLECAIRAHPSVDFFHSSRIIIDGHSRPISGVHYSKASFQLRD